jgi:hypothetical protein
MTFYLCPHCKKPAFYFHKRPNMGDRLTYQNIYTNGNWIPQLGGMVYCQMCMSHIKRLVVENVMDNLEYLESLV